jgi:hypothetical protein
VVAVYASAVDVVAVPTWCLARHKELPEDDVLNVETCRSMLFVEIVFEITVQSLVKL